MIFHTLYNFSIYFYQGKKYKFKLSGLSNGKFRHLLWDKTLLDCGIENQAHCTFSSFYLPFSSLFGGRSGGAMVLGKLQVPGRPTVWTTVGQGPTALAVGAGGLFLDIFTLVYPLFSFSLSLGDGPI